MTTDICFQGIPEWVTAINNQTHIAALWCGASGPPSGTYSTINLDFTKALGTISDKSLAQYDDLLTDVNSGSSVNDGGGVYYALNYSSPSFSTAVGTGSWTIPSGNSDYQYKCWALCGTSSITRYHGYKVVVVEVINTDTVTVGIYYTNYSTPQVQLNVQLTSTATCLPASYDANTITAVKDTIGALYLSSTFITNNSLDIPKLPPSLGRKPWPTTTKQHK
jgi:hypothetical protein